MYVACYYYYPTLVLLCLLLSAGNIHAQASEAYLKNLAFEEPDQKKVRIHFKKVNNLIVIPVQINGTDSLNFILDSGVGYPLLSSKAEAARMGVNMKRLRHIVIRGLGEEGDLDAFHSWGNIIRLPGGVMGVNQDMLFPDRDIYHLSENMGMQIHGVIGYNVFADFVVEVDYLNSVLTLYAPDYFARRMRKRRKRKSTVIPIKIEGRKCFVYVSIKGTEEHLKNLKLLVDTGASGAITLFENSSLEIDAPEDAIETYLGVGLSGDMYGKLVQKQELQLAKYSLRKPVVVYPKEEAVRGVMLDTARNGSIGGEVLRRFRVTFDYANGEMYLRANSDFKDVFYYNLSGMDIRTPIPGFPFYEVSKVRKKSPASMAGIRQGDRIISINGVDAVHFSYDQILEMLHKRKGHVLSMVVEKPTGIHKARIKLVDPFDKKNGEN
ncbi:PDZ domain-containing protein [Limibacter armeniacum]|uniref:PDZ domain-containing protein n=1 Tax=Limibacter armeniacum TaxID=466084 RepID=UPI002FE5C7C9